MATAKTKQKVFTVSFSVSGLVHMDISAASMEDALVLIKAISPEDVIRKGGWVDWDKVEPSAVFAP